MLATGRTDICSVRYCGRLVNAALPTPTRSPPNFNTRVYCSERCAELHARGEHRTPSGPLVSCDICVEDKPLTDYIHKIEEHGAFTGQWNVPIPYGCLPHIAPELLDLKGGVCTDCLRSHILTQFENRGAINVACIQTHPPAPARINTTVVMTSTLTVLSHDWLPYAHRFLAPDQHSTYFQQLFDFYIHTTGTRLWACPSNCGYSNGILEPNNTSGFPHVECPGCHGRFCANCKVDWHTHQTCQQYRATHPEVRDKDEEKQLREMARLGARRCPRCQFVIIKDGGCDHVFCEQCHFDFNWPQAELVTAPVEIYVPASVPGLATHASGSVFRGWAQLRQAQEEYINRNHINDTPFDIGDGDGNTQSNSTQRNDGIFYYNRDIGFWSPEICELDAIAAREAGKRFIRQPSHDRDRLWAFIEADRDHEGGVDLHEALRLEMQRHTADHPQHWMLPGGPVDLPLPDLVEIEAFEDMLDAFIAPPVQPADGEGGNVQAGVLFGGFGLGIAVHVPTRGPGAQFHPAQVDAAAIEDLIDRMMGLGGV